MMQIPVTPFQKLGLIALASVAIALTPQGVAAQTAVAPNPGDSTGTITGPDGKPIAGVDVRISALTPTGVVKPPSLPPGSKAVVQPQPVLQIGHAKESEISALSQTGFVKPPSLPPGSKAVVQPQPVLQIDHAKEGEISTLSPTGVVKPPSLPPGSKAVVQPQPVLQIGHVKGSDANGRFAIDHSITGAAMLSIDHPPYAQYVKTLQLPAKDIQVRLAPGGATIHGTVKNLETGKPIPNAKVTALPIRYANPTGAGDAKNGRQLYGSRMETTTDAQGHYTIARMPPGEFSFDVVADDLVKAPAKSAQVKTPSLEENQELTLPDTFLFSGYTMRGKVTDADTGKPVQGAKVSFGMGGASMRTLGGHEIPPTVSAADGSYAISGLRPFGGNKRLKKSTKEGFSFGFVNVKADGYKRETFLPKVEGEFDASKLAFEQNFKLRPSGKLSSQAR